MEFRLQAVSEMGTPGRLKPGLRTRSSASEENRMESRLQAVPLQRIRPAMIGFMQGFRRKCRCREEPVALECVHALSAFCGGIADGLDGFRVIGEKTDNGLFRSGQ